MHDVVLAVVLALVVGARAAEANPVRAVTAPPAALVSAWKLSPVYTQYLDAGGMPILASANVLPDALREAAYVVDHEIGHRPDILAAIAKQHVRLVVMGTHERTTDIPEHADLAPKDYWDKRARGLGATTARPASSCAEENVLNLDGDPYAAENILVHEFGHTIAQIGLAAVDPTFDRRLRETYAHAMAHALWKNTYAATNADEYWAEGTQSWFDTNRTNDSEHGPIGTRAQLVAYDPELAKLLAEVYGDRPWRYQKIERRDKAGRAHLAGFDRATAPKFAWAAPATVTKSTALALQAMTSPIAARVTPNQATAATSLHFLNHRAAAIDVLWVSFDGRRVKYATLRPGAAYVQATYVGHVWIVATTGGGDLGITVAIDAPGVVDVK